MAEPQYIKTQIPEGRSGAWWIEKFQVEPLAAGTAQPSDTLDCDRIRPGLYTRLKERDTVFMTDLYYEWYTQKVAMKQACRRGGHILISGLGFGMVAESILQTPDCPVESVTILELSEDVRNLSAPYLEARYPDRLQILIADVYTWQIPDNRNYSVIWHDIWPNPQAPEVDAEMDRLDSKYSTHCDWHGCWPREYRWIYGQKPWNRDD